MIRISFFSMNIKMVNRIIIQLIMVAIGMTVDRMSVDLTTTHITLTTQANSVARAAAGSGHRRTNRRHYTRPNEKQKHNQ